MFPGTLAAQYLVPGDIVLNIQGYSTKDLLYIEAVELVREPGKSLELVIQKSQIPKDSIWGPEPVLQRPSEWLRRSPSPFVNPDSAPQAWRPPSPTLQRPSEWLNRPPSPYPTAYFKPIATQPYALQRSLSLDSDYTWPTTPTLQRPSDWLRSSPLQSSNLYDNRNVSFDSNRQTTPTSFNDNNRPRSVGYRSASTLSQHFESINQNALEENTRTAYTPSALDRSITERYEQSGTDTAFQKFERNSNGSQLNCKPLTNANILVNKNQNTEHNVGSYENKQPYYTSYENKQPYYTTHEKVENTGMSPIPQLNKDAIYFDGRMQTEINPSIHKGLILPATKMKSEEVQFQKEKQQTVSYEIGTYKSKEQEILQSQQIESKDGSGIATHTSTSYTAVARKTETTIPAEVLKRPISPEFIMFPNSKGDSLLKLVLNKSLGNFSPADFEKMKAEEYYSSEDDDGSSTDSDDDDTEEDSEVEVESQDQADPHALTKSGSVIFERYWMLENENESPTSGSRPETPTNSPLSRNSSWDSIHSGSQTPTSHLSRSSSLASVSSLQDARNSNANPRPGTPSGFQETLSRSSSKASLNSRPGTPAIPENYDVSSYTMSEPEVSSAFFDTLG